MIDLLREDFVIRALIATVAVGVAAPVVGAFAVQRGQSLIGDGVAHVAFAGVGLAFLAGVAPLWGALAAAVVAAVVLHVLQRRGLAGDVALAVVFYSGIALGFLFAARAGAAGAGLIGVLFGSPLTLDPIDVAVVVGLAVATVGTVVVLRRPLVAIAFDADAARVSGVRVERLTLGMTVLAALVVVGGMLSVGILLVGALMVIPTAAAARVARSYRGTLALASLAGGVSAVGGMLASLQFDLAPGPAVVLSAVVLYAVVSLIRT